MDRKAMYKLSYGLFILTAKEAEKDNGCIINTAIQAASEPNRLSICVNKANYTHDMIQRTGKFTVSLLSQRKLAKPRMILYVLYVSTRHQILKK